MEFNYSITTDVGRKRKHNQDNGGIHPELGLFLVADGMGGHQGGETASAMVAEIVPKILTEETKKNEFDPKNALVRTIEVANQSIYDRSQSDESLRGMGTTTTAIVFDEGRATIGQVGDSRCYFVRPGALWQLTRDHSLVEERVRAGVITREQAENYTMKNVITRSVGFEQNVNVETFQLATQPGDLFLICSDGLSSLIDDCKILELVEAEAFTTGDLESIGQKLVDAANDAGGDDNVTVVLVHVVK